MFALTPRFGGSGSDDSESLVSSGTDIATASESSSVLLAHGFSRMISPRRSFVLGPAAARSRLNILRTRRG